MTPKINHSKKIIRHEQRHIVEREHQTRSDLRVPSTLHRPQYQKTTIKSMIRRRRHYPRKPKGRRRDFYRYEQKRPQRRPPDDQLESDHDDNTSVSSTTADQEPHTQTRERISLTKRCIKNVLSLQSRSFLAEELSGKVKGSANSDKKSKEKGEESSLSRFESNKLLNNISLSNHKKGVDYAKKEDGGWNSMFEGKKESGGTENRNNKKEKENSSAGLKDSSKLRDQGDCFYPTLLDSAPSNDLVYGIRVRGEVVKRSLCLELESNDLFFKNPKSMNAPLSLTLKQPKFS